MESIQQYSELLNSRHVISTQHHFMTTLSLPSNNPVLNGLEVILGRLSHDPQKKSHEFVSTRMVVMVHLWYFY